MSSDKSLLPASVIQAGMVDPAAGTGAPPNFGQPVVDHIHTTSGRFGVASRAYITMDEALRDSRSNAERMRNDCGIMECVEQRQRAVALLPWHIEPEDDKNEDHKALATEMTSILDETPRFTEYRRVLLEAIWYGRYAIANQFGIDYIGGQQRRCVRRWEPRHGDKLVFRFDDGDRTTMEDQVGIRVSTAFRQAWNRNHTYGSRRRSQVEPTEMGMVYWLNKWERETTVVHRHMVEDGPFEDPRAAGRVNGIGIRHRIYWTWYAMVECLQRVIEYLDRAAFGIEIWPYPSGNAEAKKATENAAYQQLSGGRTIIMAPVQNTENAELYMPRLIEPGLGGVNTTIEVIQGFFFHRIKRYILGQILSSEAEATGLGSGVADAHLATLADILSYDARNLEETLTRDMLRPLQRLNYSSSQNVKLKLKINTESDNVKEKLESLQMGWEMGMKIKEDEIYRVIGVAKPDAEDLFLQNPQYSQQAMNSFAASTIPGSSGGQIFDAGSFGDQFLREMDKARGALSVSRT